MRALIITADDYGYRRSYDGGILEAAGAGAVDAVSVMVLREGLDADALLRTGVEVGLHLELPDGAPAGSHAAERAVAAQVGAFQQRFGRSPAHLDGHHHRHAGPPYSGAVARLARELGVPVRSVDARHRGTLRFLGVAAPDRLIGRLGEDEPAVPPEIERLLAGEPLPEGVTEWIVHPGRRDAEARSRYDEGREEDLRVLLELAVAPRLRAVRSDHGRALRAPI